MSMNFTEKTHAYLVICFYRRLIEHFGEQGKNAFVHATQYYGGQRGRRMAQRAIRNGETLTFDTYCRYGEWVNTQTSKDLGCANKVEVLLKDPDYIKKVTICPWHTEFKESRALDAGVLYCTYLDSAICRGFNPAIKYSVPKNLNKDGYCIHTIKDCFLKEGTDFEKHKEYLKDFDYHCAHLFFAYREVVCAIFGKEGSLLAEEVLQDFRSRCGDEMTELLLSFQDTNFNICE